LKKTPGKQQKKIPSSKQKDASKQAPRSVLFRLAHAIFLIHAIPILIVLAKNIPLWPSQPAAVAPPYVPNPGLAEAPTLRSCISTPAYHTYAPVFFGFYSYYGFISSLPDTSPLGCSGCSAGAMAAVFDCAKADKSKRISIADDIGKLKLTDIADTYGFPVPFRFGIFSGFNFVRLFNEYTTKLLGTTTPPDFTASPGKVSITVYDVLNHGLISMSPYSTPTVSLAEGVRASATFPVLFSPFLYTPKTEVPAPWYETIYDLSAGKAWLLLDGGIGDPHGYIGVHELLDHHDDKKNEKRRAINVIGGGFNELLGLPTPADLRVDELLTVLLVNSPSVHPFNMDTMASVVVEKTREATSRMLDVKAEERGLGWWVLTIDCS
jgi:hypothetical protein